MVEHFVGLRARFLFDLPDVDGAFGGRDARKLTGWLVDRGVRTHRLVSVDPCQHRPSERGLVERTVDLESGPKPAFTASAGAGVAVSKVRLVDVGRRAVIGLPPGQGGGGGVWADAGNPLGDGARWDGVVRQLGELHAALPFLDR